MDVKVFWLAYSIILFHCVHFKEKAVPVIQMLTLLTIINNQMPVFLRCVELLLQLKQVHMTF